jgi:hypothetical protein
MQTIIASFVMSLLLLAIGMFAINKGLSGNLTAADVSLVVSVLALIAGLLGLNLCWVLVRTSARLEKIEKALEHK